MDVLEFTMRALGAIVLISFLVLIWTPLKRGCLKLDRKLRFRSTFGAWPEKDPHLKGLVRKRHVEPGLRMRAESLHSAYVNQTELLEDIRLGKIGYKEAKKRLRRSYKAVRRAELRFYKAWEVAHETEFVSNESSYKAYLVPVAEPVAEKAK